MTFQMSAQNMRLGQKTYIECKGDKSVFCFEMPKFFLPFK